jgi:DNA polymerase-3 subunit beta
MECKIERSALLAGLGVVADAVSGRPRLPILEHTHVTASDAGLTLMATDTEIEIQTVVAADINQPGVMTLPCQKMLSICRALPSGAPIDMRLGDKGQITIKSGRSRFVVHGLDPDDFPTRTTEAPETVNDQLVVPVPVLRSVLEKARQVMPTSNVRPYLNGILLAVNGAHLVATATDGHVMVRATARMQASRVTAGQWILPAKGVRALMKILNADGVDETQVSLALSSSAVTATVGPTMLRTQLIDGRYPDIEPVIPRYTPDERITIDVDRNDLQGLVERVSIMTAVSSDKRTSAVAMAPVDQEIRVRASSQDGEAADAVDARITRAAETLCEFGANPAYCTAILAALDTERVHIMLRDGTSGALFQGLREGVVQEDVLGVLMPIRL